MELERRSSGVAKAGLTTGIIGTVLGAAGVLGSGANALGGLFGGNGGNGMNGCCMQNVIPVAVPVPTMGMGYGFNYNNTHPECACSENMNVNRYELELQQKIAEKDAQIALRDANVYNDQKMLEMYKYVDGKFNAIEQQLCAQEVQNQATKDSFQLVRQETQCCCDKLQTQINNEGKERRCADNTIITYANATFYPKQVADVTVGTSTVPQATYNPLPVDTCNCNCGN